MTEFIASLSYSTIILLAYGMAMPFLLGMTVWPFWSHKRKLKKLKLQQQLQTMTQDRTQDRTQTITKTGD